MFLRALGTPALAATLLAPLALLVLLPAAAQAVAPSVTGVSITSRPILKTETPEAYHPYGPGDHIDVAVTFSRAVTVTGAPRLALTVGSRTRQADFRSASGSAVNFRYRIRGGDRDGDGVSIAADALTLDGGGIEAGSVDAALGLGSHAITNAANHRVDGGGASFDGVASPSYRFTRGVRSSFILPAAGSTQADGAYALAPAPALPGGLAFDSATRTLSGAPEVGMTQATYTLDVTHLVPGSGGIVRAVSDSLPFTIAVAGTQPAVSGVSIASRPARGLSYAAGENIDVDVTFNYPVTVTGAPRLALRIGASTRQAAYRSHRGSTVRFRYAVTAADFDGDGIGIAAGALTLNGATIRNAGGEDARLGLGAHAVAAQTGHKVSAPPRVTGVRLLTTNIRCCWGVRPAGWEDPRQTNENLYPPSLLVAVVTFDQPVAVSGAPTFAVTIGANTRRAVWNEFLSRLVHPTANPHGAGDLDVMAFHYELQASDFDGDGVGAAANALALNGATIRDAEGENAALGLGSHAIANQASLRVADTAPTFGAAEARRYLLDLRASDRLPAATGDGAMTYALTGPGAATTLSLPRGLSWNAATRTISGTPTSATAAASYTLTATDADGDTGTLTFDLSVVTDPAVGGVRITSRPASGDAYRAGETITVEVTFDQAVTVTGAPQLALTIGSATRPATGSPVAGRRALSFRYPVTTSDRDTDGISITGGALTLAGGTIRNAKGENARLGLGGHAVAGAAGHKVSTPPRVVQVNLLTTGMKCCWTRQDAGWADPRQTAHNRFAPAVVMAAVAFDQELVFGGAGRPSLALTIGGDTRQAAWDGSLSRRLAGTLGKSNGQVLAFFYTLQPSDFDGDGIGAAAGALTLPAGATLRDAQGEAAVLGLGTHAIANDPNYRVADTAPSFGTATVQPQHWVAGSASSLTLPAAAGDGAVSHALTPAQRPSWLKFDSATRVLSGTPPAAAARATYTWKATDVDGDSTALAFPLTVAAANAPKVSEVKILSSPAAHSMYAPGSAIEVGVRFDKAVSVTGTPTLALDIGGATRQARYTALRNGYLVFSWTVQQADYDTDGVSIGTGALAASAGGGIFDKAAATVRAALGLGSHVIADADGHEVGSPPRVTGVSIHSTPPQAGTYTKGTTVTVQVDFDQTVTVTGTPQLALTIGGATRQASAVAESGTGVSRSRVRFSWTVAAADADRDGLGVAAAALTLNGGTIRDLDGQDAVPGLGSHAQAAFANARVDGSRTGLWPDFGPAAGPTLTLTAGTAATHALPTAAGGDTPLRYTVSPGLPAGLSVNAATAVLSGAPRTESPQSDYTLTATDANGDAATLAFTLEVSGSRPLASGVSIASTPLAGDTYGASEEILVDVAFERTGTGAMTVRGAPRLALAVGAATRQASFLSVSGGTLRFRYTVQAEDQDADGIAVAADALALGGGLIRDAAGNNAVLGLGRHALAAAPAHKVDGGAGRAPTVAGVRVISAPASGSTYTLDETIEVEVRFDQAVGVSGTPSLALTLGSATAQAAWNRTGASPTTQIFRHVVQAADRDADGLSIGAGALAPGGGTIRNVRGGDAALGLGSHALGNQAAHKVDGSKNPAPVVTGVSLRSFQGDGWYDHGEVVEARVTFNKAVAVTGRPQLAIAIGATTRQASFHAASGARVDFRYTVQDGDHDTDGLSIGAGALALDGGTIRNHGVDAALGLGSHALGNQAAHKVDGRMARVTGVTIETTPAGSAGYGAGEEIRVRVDFDLALGDYHGSRLALTIGDDTREATFAYARRDHGMPVGHRNLLHYTYTVRTTDRDADGLSIAANALSGTIRRRDGNPAQTNLGSHARGAQAAHKVTGAVVTPRVTRISINGPLNGVTFGLGEKIKVTLEFNAPVAAPRGAHLALTVGGATHRLNALGVGPRIYKSNYGFSYVVQASDRDADGIGIAADGLTLPQHGTLRSAVGVDAALGLPAAPVRIVDGSHNPPAKGTPVLAGRARHDTFRAGESFDVVVFWSKPVTISGTPTLAMQVGSVTRRLRLVRGGGTEAVFRYTVRHDDRDPDGVSIAADALRLEGASITGPGGKAAQLRLTKSIVNDASFKVGSAARPTPTFGAAVVPARDWTVGVPVNFTLPPATDGSGTLRYALLGPSVTPGQYRTTYLWLPPGLRYTAPANHTLSGGTISGTISGHTPTDMDMNGHTWRLTATDADADTATLDFLARIVPDRTPSFGEETIGDREWIENAAITAFDLPEATGGNGGLTYTLAPALPGGVSHAGRRVSGSPGAAMARTRYTWTATDADGDQASLTFHATVAADRAPSFGEATISDLSWLQGSPITEVTLPEATGGNAPLTYGIATPGSTRIGTQGLPQGIELDGRVLKGTPSEVQESSDVDYAWLVVDADGDTAELAFDVEVYADRLPSFGDAALADRTWTQRRAITAFTLPAATGGDGDLTHTLTPDLPAGVVRNATTREVSGTPTAALAATTYTWTATDADGDQVELTFTAAVDGIPTFGDETVADVTWTKGKAIDSFFLPEAAGGDGRLTYTLTPDPPAGVDRVGTTREVSGTPTGGLARSRFQWAVEDEDGDGETLEFHVTVVEPPVATLALSASTIDEGGTGSTATVTATLDKAWTADTTVTIAGAAGTNAAADDFALSTAKTLTIAAGATTSSGTVTIAAVDNTKDEHDKTVTVSGSAVNDDLVTGPANLTLTIADDDDAPAVSISSPSVNEGAAGSTTALPFQVTLDAASGKRVTVTYAEGSGGTATAGEDYTALSSGALTIAAGATSGTIDVSVTGDGSDEPNETVEVVLADPVNAVLGPSTGTGTILDDDASATSALTLTPSTIDEGGTGSTATVTATLSRAVGAATTVTVSAAAGTNAGAGDFTLSTKRKLTIAAGATASRGTVIIAAVDDADPEPDKSVTVSGSVDNADVAAPAAATLTIADDDRPSVPTLFVDSPKVAEGGPGDPSKSNALTWTVTLTPASDREVAVAVAIDESAGTATAGTYWHAAEGADHGFPPESWLVFSPGETSGTVSVSVYGDSRVEPDETVVLALSNPVNAALGDTSGTGTIRDDDAPTVALALVDRAIAENGGTTTVTAALSHASGAATTVTVTAVSGFYTVGSDATIVIAAGATANASDTVTITAVDDDVDNVGGRSTTVTGTASNNEGAGGVTGAALSLTDDEATPVATLALSEPDSSKPDTIHESGQGDTSTVTATLSGKSSEALTLTVTATAVGPALADDFTMSSGATLTIAAGATASTGAVTITAVDNAKDEADKSLTVAATVGGASGVAAPAAAALTIADDDAAPALSITSPSVAEGAPGETAALAFAVTLDAVSGRQVTVAWAEGAGGTATRAADYTAPAGGTLTFAAGDTAATIDVSVTGDGSDEPDETVVVTLSGPVNAAIPDGAASGTGTITDDDEAPGVTLAAAEGAISEKGGATTVSATLSHPSSAATTVTVSAVEGAYTVGEDALIVIAAGSTANAADTVTVTAVDDDVDNVAARSATVTGEAANDQGVGAVTGTALTLTDDEATPVATLALAEPDASKPDTVHESGEGNISSVTATLSGKSSEAVILMVSATAVAPAAASDFMLSSPATLTIAAGSTASAGLAFIAAADNAKDEPDKSVTVSATASGTSGVANPADATLTIADDDAAPSVTLAVADGTIDENGGATTVTATLSHPSSAATTVTVGAVSGFYTVGEDAEIVIAAGATANASDTVAITAVDDDVDNVAARSATVTGTAANDQGIGTVTGAALTLGDDEATPVATLALAPDSISENGGVATVSAVLDRASSEAVTLTVAADAGTNALSGDFTLSSAATLTIAAGATASTGTVTVSAEDDTTDAPDRSVTVSATVSGASGVANPADATLAITDDDAAPAVTLAVADDSISENGGATTVTATLSHPSSAATTVTVGAVSGSYTVGADAEIVIAAGATANASDTAAITAVDDDVDNVGDRSVTVAGTAANDQGIGTVTGAALTLGDDEDPPALTLALTPASIDESGSGSTSTVTATLSGKSSEAVTLTVSATAVAPAAASDFLLSSPATLTIAAGATASAGVVTLAAVDDTTDAPDKSVTVSATVSGSSGVANPSDGTLTIADDDAAPAVALALAPSSISENGGVATVSAALSRPSSEPTTLTVAASAGPHTAATDFTLSGNTTLTVAAGSTVSGGVVTVAAVDDDEDAAHDKSVRVSATAANGQGVAGDPSPVVLAITDDDVDLKPTFGDATIADRSWPASTEVALLELPEATGGDGALSYTLSPALPSWLTRSGFAVRGTTPGASVASANYRWTVRDEDGDEASLAFALEVTENVVLTTDATPSLSISSPRVDEGAAGGTATLRFKVGLSAASTNTVTLSYGDAGTGTADSGTDYTALASGTLTFAAGETSKTVLVTVAGDGVDEPDETVEVKLGAPVNAQIPVSGRTGTGTIADDDAAPGVALAVADDAIAEDGGTTTVSAALSHPSSAATTLTVTAVEGAYTVGQDAEIVIAAGSTTNASDTATVRAVNDAIDNVGDRSVTVTATADNDQGAGTVTGASLTLTDDEATPAATLALSPSSISENGGVSTVTAALSGASSAAVTLTVSASGDGFTLSTAKTLTVAAGSTASTGTVTLAATNDATDAPNKSVTVSATVSGSSGVANPIARTLTITDDDDAPTVALAVAAPLIDEKGGTTTVSATLSHPSSAATTVTVEAVTGFYTVGEDAEIVIAAGATANVDDTVTITAVDDEVDNLAVRPVTVTATASNDQGIGEVTGALLKLSGSAVLNRQNPQTPSLSISSPSVDEGASGTTATLSYRVRLSAVSASTVTVAYVEGTGGSATRGTDYTVLAGGTLTFAAGETSKTVTVTVTGDGIDELDETVEVVLSDPANAQVPESGRTGTGTITDDDAAPTVALAVADSAIAENGGTTTVSATLSHPSSAATTVTVTAVEGAYTVGQDAEIVIAAGSTTNAADTVTITAVDDTIDTVNDRSVTVTGTAVNDQGIGAVAGAGLTLTDSADRLLLSRPSDEGTPTATLALSPSSISENGGVSTVTATLDRASSAAVTLTVSASGDGFTQTGTTLTIGAGSTTSTGAVTLAATNDATDAPNRSVTVSATVGGTSGVADPSDATLTITDDDAAPTVALAVADSAITENGGTTTVSATLSHPSSAATTVTVQAVTGFYTVGQDAEIVIAAGSTTNAADTVTVRAVNDTIDNVGDRSVTVTATAVNDQGAGTVTGAHLTLTDDEGAPAATLVLSPSSISENGGVSTVTATLSGASSAAVTLTIAASGDGFTQTGTTLTVAAGSTASTGAVALAATNDTTDSPNGTVTVSATVSGASGVANPESKTLTITDDDGAPTLALALASSSIPEDGGTTTVSATLSHPSSAATTVTVQAASGFYTVGQDAEIVIAAGSTTNAADTVTVTAVDDAIDNAGDRSVTVTGTAVNGQGVGAVTGALLTLSDDEATPAATLALSPSSISEDGGMSTVTATLDRASSAAVTLTVAASGDGFTLSTGKTLTLAAGSTASTGTVTLAATDDATDSPNKSVTVSATVSGTSGVASPSDATLTISDDDGAPAVALALTSSSIPENGGTTTLSATLSHPSSAATTVTVTAVEGAYTVGQDARIVIAAGSTTNAGDTVTVRAVDDAIDNVNDRSVTVTGSVSNGQGIGTVTGALLTLSDDEATPAATLALSPSSITEDSGVSTVTATLSGVSSTPVTLTVSASGDGFTLSTAKTLTVGAGSTASTGTVTVTATNDTTDAPNKSVTVSATVSGTSGVANPAARTLTITDDDGVPTVALALASSSIPEDGGTTTVSATLSHPSSAATTVTVQAASGFYTVGQDARIVIVAGSTTNAGDTVTLRAVDDAIDNANNRSVTVTATASNDQGIGAVTGARLTLTDDEATPTATLALSPSSISEDGGVSTVTAVLDRASSAAVTLTVSALGDGFSLSTAKTLTVAAGSTASTGTVALAATDDTTDAPNKSVTVSATVSGASGVANPESKTLTITDDDGAPTLALALASSSIPEDGGTTTVSATLSHPSSAATTVTVQAASGFYTVGQDAEIVIAAGRTTNAADTVTVTAVNDAIDNVNDRSGTVTGSAANGQGVGSVTGASLTLSDDEATPAATLALSPSSISENGGMSTVTVTLDRASSAAVTLTVAASGDGFTLSTGKTLTLAAGSMASTGTVTISATDDATDAPNKSVTVSATVSGTSGVANPESKTLTITDDDDAPTVALAVADSAIAENGGTTTVSATLSHPSSAATTVTVQAASGFYTVGQDARIVIAAGSTTNAGDTVTVTAVNDAIDNANNRSVTVTGSASNGQGIGAVSGASLTLTDDEGAPTATLALSPALISENGGVSTVTATLSGASSAAVTLTIAASGDGFSLSTAKTLTVAAGSTASTGTVTISATDDATDSPNRSVTVSATVSGASGVANPAARTLTIMDDDEAPTVALALASSSIPENGGTTTVSATLSHPSSAATTVTVQAVTGFYTVGQDAEIVIAAGSTTNAADTVTVRAVNDAIDNTSNRSVTVTGTASSDQGVGTVTGVSLTLTDDEGAPTAILVLSPSSISENGGVSTVTATLSGASSAAVTLTIAASGDGFTLSTAKTLTVAAGSTASTGTVTVTAVDDAVDAPNKSATVSATVSGDGGIANPADATLTIIDDDDAPTLAIDSPIVAEGAAGTTATLRFTVRLSAASGKQVTVAYAEGTGGTATSGTDYTALAAGTLTFAAGETSRTLAVSVTGDATDEPDETVVVELSNAVNAAVSTGTGTGTITDDDGAPALAIGSPSVAEGNGGSADLTFTVSLGPASGQQVTVAYAEGTGGTATQGTDYTALAPGTLTFAAGETSRTLAVSVTGDTTDEPDETVVVELSNAMNAAISTGTGTGTITDDDGTPTLAIDSPSVAEGDSGSADLTFTVSLGPASGRQVTVAYAEGTGGTATQGTDYTALAAGTLTFAAGETSRTLTVSVIGDTTEEPNETVMVELSGPTHATLGTASGAGTITDDDGTPVVVVDSTPASAPSFEDARVAEKLWTQHAAIEAFTLPPATGGDGPLAYTLSPALPPGVSREAGHRVSGASAFPAGASGDPGRRVSGAPAEPRARTEYVWTAADARGRTARLVFHVTVAAAGGVAASEEMEKEQEQEDRFPRFPETLPAQRYWVGTAVPGLVLPAAEGGDGPLAYTLAPSLPEGLAFDPATRTVGGTPAVAMAETGYTLTAKDADGDEAELAFTVEVWTPIILSMADADAEEGEEVTFVLELSPPAPRPMTVAWVTATGTATAGGDYLHTPDHRLSIAAGVGSMRVAIPTMDDKEVEPDETFTVAVVPEWPEVKGVKATGTIIDDDAAARGRALEVVLASFGRAVATEAVGVLEERFTGSLGGGSQVTLGGLRVPAGGGGEAGSGPLGGGEVEFGGLGGDGLDSGEGSGSVRSMTAREVVSGSSFALSFGAPEDGVEGGAGGWTVWGRTGRNEYSGRPERGLSVEGEVFGGYLGVDTRVRGDLLMGVATSYSEGSMGYESEGERGEVEATLAGVLPYGRWTPREDVSVWGMAGAAWGDAELEDGVGVTGTGIEMRLLALGWRKELGGGEGQGADGVEWALKGDGFAVEMESEGARLLPGTKSGVQRLRMMVEGSKEWALGEDGRMRSRMELGGRWDGGRVEEGYGVEIGGGVEYGHAGLEVEARGRYLLAHRSGGFEERGAGVSVRWDPGGDGEGAWLGMAPRWGASGSGVESLWGSVPTGGGGKTGAVWGVEAGYGWVKPFEMGVTVGVEKGEGDSYSSGVEFQGRIAW